MLHNCLKTHALLIHKVNSKRNRCLISVLKLEEVTLLNVLKSLKIIYF